MALKNQGFITAAHNHLDVPSGGMVLEIGPGDGRVLAQLSAARPDLTLIGLDHSKLMIRRLKKRSGLLIIKGDGEALPLGSETLDAVLIINCFQFWQTPTPALLEIARALRPGGQIIITQRIGKLTWTGGVEGRKKGQQRLSKAAEALSKAGLTVTGPFYVPVGRLEAGTVIGSHK